MEALIDGATSHLLTQTDWSLNLNIWDSLNVADSATLTKAITHLVKRLASRSAQVQLLTITLISSLVSNGSSDVIKAISSRLFLDGLDRTIIKARTVHATVKNKALEFLEQVSKDHAEDSDFDLIIEYQEKLAAANIRYKPNQDEAAAERLGKQAATEKQNQLLKEEEADFQAALLASTLSTSPVQVARTLPTASPIYARVLYDLTARQTTATEEREITLQRGEVIEVLEKPYLEWWKGKTMSGVGIFPVNYVEVLEGYVPVAIPIPAEKREVIPVQPAVLQPIPSNLPSPQPIPSGPPPQRIDDTRATTERLLMLMNSGGRRDEIEHLFSIVLNARPQIEQKLHFHRDQIDGLIDLQHRIAIADAQYRGIAPPPHPHQQFEQPPPLQNPNPNSHRAASAAPPIQPPPHHQAQSPPPNVAQAPPPHQVAARHEEEEDPHWTLEQRIEWRNQWTTYRAAQAQYLQSQEQETNIQDPSQQNQQNQFSNGRDLWNRAQELPQSVPQASPQPDLRESPHRQPSFGTIPPAYHNESPLVTQSSYSPASSQYSTPTPYVNQPPFNPVIQNRVENGTPLNPRMTPIRQSSFNAGRR